MDYWVYILYSAKLDRFYTGSTGDISVRMEFHKSSQAHKFTGKADDWELFFSFECKNKKQAVMVEKHIKRMKSKKYIQNLKRYPEMIQKLKEKYSDC